MWPQSRYRGRQRVFLRTMSPPHIYMEVACTAKRNFDRECKKTFATKSAKSRREQMQRRAFLFNHLISAGEPGARSQFHPTASQVRSLCNLILYPFPNSG